MRNKIQWSEQQTVADSLIGWTKAHFVFLMGVVIGVLGLIRLNLNRQILETSDRMKELGVYDDAVTESRQSSEEVSVYVVPAMLFLASLVAIYKNFPRNGWRDRLKESENSRTAELRKDFVPEEKD